MHSKSSRTDLQNIIFLLKRYKFCITFLLFLCVGCTAPTVTQSNIDLEIKSDNKTVSLQVPSGTTVQDALGLAGITLNSLDTVNPPAYTVLSSKGVIEVTRVTESYAVNDVVIPFEHKVVHNESLTEGETLLIQPGVNGLQEITYRIVYQDGKEVSNQEYKTSVITEPVPEIMMVGVQATFSAVNISGRLAYLTAGNAWFMDGSTGQRLPIVTTGDLDGRIFSLSPNGKWLLFTRASSKPADQEINTLWVASVGETVSDPISLRASNVIHYADWVPGKQLTVVYSTVEPRATSPGWQANNNLMMQTFSVSGYLPKSKTLVEANSGGIYGWWGSSFAWSTDGTELAYTRPDGVGLVDINSGELSSLLTLVPYQTLSNWAWIPGLSWSPDGSALFTSNHFSSESRTVTEDSPDFDLTAILPGTSKVISMVQKTGMFAYPSPSPILSDNTYQLAYLQAIFPETSDSSKYRLMVVDQDGSNPKVLYPSSDSAGIEPQKIFWSPAETDDSQMYIGLVIQGNLWLVSSDGSLTQQITGDGSISKIDWK